MKFHRQLLIIATALIVSGCTPTGTYGSKTLCDKDREGVYKIINDNITTKSDARRIFGDPEDIDFSNAQEKWTYLYLNKKSLMRNYIPVVNFFTRGTKDTQKKLILVFNSSGIIQSSYVSETCGKTKYGLFD